MGIAKFIAAVVLLLASFGASAQTYNYWGTYSPTGTASQSSAQQFGEEFYSDVDGYIIGIRWWKNSTETGTHAVAVFKSDGTSLATVSSTPNETASGWQTVMLATPVAVTANTHYVMVRHYNGGTGVSYMQESKTFPVNVNPLHVTQDRYLTTSSGTSFPTSTNTTISVYIDTIFVKKSNTYILIPNN